MTINVLLKLKVLMVKMIASILPQLHVGCVDPKFICKDPEVVKNIFVYSWHLNQVCRSKSLVFKLTLVYDKSSEFVHKTILGETLCRGSFELPHRYKSEVSV